MKAIPLVLLLVLGNDPGVRLGSDAALHGSDLSLTPGSFQGATITGQVVDARTMQPLRGAIVSAARVPGTDPDVAPNIGYRTAADGKFKLRGVAPGIVNFFVTKAGYPPGPYASVRPAVDGEQIDNVVLTVLPGASLGGRLLDESGQPVAGERVAVRIPAIEGTGTRSLPSQQAGGTATTDPDGGYWIGGLPPGEHVVTVEGSVDQAWIQSVGGEAVPSLDSTGLPTGNLMARVALATGEERIADIVIRFGTNYGGTKPTADGSATISGQVVDKRGVGIPHSAVLLRDAKNAMITTRADSTGRFLFQKIPAGSFTIGARPDYMSRLADTEPMTTLQIAAGSRTDNIMLTSTRGGTITGVLTDEFGDPVSGAVFVTTPMALGQSGGFPSIVSRPESIALTGGAANADARGRYRITGLAPGEYVVSARIGDRAAVRTEFYYEDHSGRKLVQGPLYYPGVPTVSRASKIVVSEGSESTGVDVTVQLVVTANIHVTVTADRPVGDIRLHQILFDEQRPILEKTTKMTGPSTMLEVMQGRYWLLASADVVSTTDTVTRLWSTFDVDADALLPATANMVLEPGANISGRIVFEGKEPNRQNAGAFLVPVTAIPGLRATTMEGESTLTVATGEFSIQGVMPGRYAIQAGGSNSQPRTLWTLKAAVVRGRDVLDEPFDLGPGEEIDDVRLTVTDRIGELSGKVTDGADKPGQDWVLVFSTDRKYWWSGSRRVRATRPNAEGQYVLRGLPAGTYVVTLIPNPMVLNELTTKLQALAATGVRVTLAEGDRKVQDLRVK